MTTPHMHVIASSSGHSQSTIANCIAGNHFRVGKKIGEGSFGAVFEGTKLLNNQPVAIKFEPQKSDTHQLRNEFRIYRTLSGTVGVPQVHHFGKEGLHNILVIDILGPNLEDLFDTCSRKFTIKTVCMCAKQMITRIQSVHDKSLIYRDIKPDDFLVGVSGTKTANTIHIIDFGVAKHYRDPKTKAHIPYGKRRSICGSTAQYMSINTHLGLEHSRRDDLESLGHVFMYFLRGDLPWQDLRAATNKQKYKKIGEEKQTTPIAKLCEGFPEEFSIYMNYVRKLGFEETPDYNFLRELFSKVLKDIGERDDGVFDWLSINNDKVESLDVLSDKLRTGLEQDSILDANATRRPTKLEHTHAKLSRGFFDDARDGAPSSTAVSPPSLPYDTHQQQSSIFRHLRKLLPFSIRRDALGRVAEPPEPPDCPATSPRLPSDSFPAPSTTLVHFNPGENSTSIPALHISEASASSITSRLRNLSKWRPAHRHAGPPIVDVALAPGRLRYATVGAPIPNGGCVRDEDFDSRSPSWTTDSHQAPAGEHGSGRRLCFCL